jgi:hypothetical protein
MLHEIYGVFFYSLFGVEWVKPQQVLDLLSSWGNSLGRGQVQQIWKQVSLYEMPVLELRRNVLNTLFVWVSTHHSPSSVTFAEFLISCSFVSSF